MTEIDLNLLHVSDQLYEECNVTRTSGLSYSHAASARSCTLLASLMYWGSAVRANSFNIAIYKVRIEGGYESLSFSIRQMIICLCRAGGYPCLRGAITPAFIQ